MADSPFLLENVSTNITGPPFQLRGGTYIISARATSFGGGAVTFGISANGTAGTFIPLAAGVGVGVPISLDADSQQPIEHTVNSHFIKATLSGSTGASGVNVIIQRQA